LLRLYEGAVEGLRAERVGSGGGSEKLDGIGGTGGMLYSDWVMDMDLGRELAAALSRLWMNAEDDDDASRESETADFARAR